MAPERRARLLASADVSTLVPAPPGAGEGAPAPAPRPHSSVALSRDVIAGLAVAAAIVALAFLTSSSIDQTVTPGNTWSEIVITFLGAGGVCRCRPHRRPRASLGSSVSRALRRLHRVRRAVSILWSVQPDWSWFGANQLLSYLAAFAGAVALGAGGAATLARARGGGGHGGGRAVRLGPAGQGVSHDAGARQRLRAPAGAVRLLERDRRMRRAGLAPALWAATRPASPTVLRALTIPAMTLMISRDRALVLALGRPGRGGGGRGMGGIRAAAAAHCAHARPRLRCARCRSCSSRCTATASPPTM